MFSNCAHFGEGTFHVDAHVYIAESYHIYVLTRIFRFENENSKCKKVVNFPLQNPIFERQVNLQVNCNIYINLLTWMVILDIHNMVFEDWS